MNLWPLKIKIVERSQCRLTLGEWRRDTALVARARKALNNPDVAILIDVLRNSGPANAAFPVPTPMETRAAYQSFTEGYAAALNNLEALATQEEIPTPMADDFLYSE